MMSCSPGERSVEACLLRRRWQTFVLEGKAGQRRDGKFIVLVSFKCDQCSGFQGRTQETKNNQEVEPRTERPGGGWPAGEMPAGVRAN